MAASAPGLLYNFPWQNWGNFKYLLYIPLAVRAWHTGVIEGCSFAQNICFHMLLLVAVRYLLFQMWGTMSRLPYFSRKYQIQTKGIKFEQIDHEASWENMLIAVALALWGVNTALAPREGLPAWDWWGLPIVLLVHMGPVEWLYYWGHRALHHHFLFTRYHQHHHSSFVTQPITSSNHPFIEIVFYQILFGLPMLAIIILGHGSLGIIYSYVLFIDTMNAWGHCNFEFIPVWTFETLWPLKYLIYSPTFHSLHHSKVHTNFCLFMPLYDYLYGTVDASSDSLHKDVRLRGSHKAKVDCVYLTHATDLLSIFHLQFGFQTFAAQPYAKKWYMWIVWPLALPLMLLAWLFAKPFVGATHFIGNKLELQSWVIPRFSFQYHLRSEAARVDGWIRDCILQAQEAGARVIALGLLNKDRKLNRCQAYHIPGLGEPLQFTCPDITKWTSTPTTSMLMTTSAMASALAPTTPMAKNITAPAISKTLLLMQQLLQTMLAKSRVPPLKVQGQENRPFLLCTAAYAKLPHLLALLPSKEHAADLRTCILPKFQDNLVYVKEYDAGKTCKVWLVDDQVGRGVQKLASKGPYFYQFGVFSIQQWRKDCFYSGIPGLRLPEDAQTINACEVWMMRSFFLLCHRSRDSARARVEAGSSHHLGSGGWASFEADFWSMTGRDPTPYEREYAGRKGLNALMDILSSRGGMNPTDMPLGRDETSD
ncbi:hypothetical protein GOP47_0003954 [Adiantum capillus-veneris]|uniref:Uncharacterized protein n=1 Tax=Adiantum capillus-veneris TaxID=13818 RepID=A0A9D4ZP98_ADICA|nr:hypothetical protein GOP47_0003954 [Adiantum capillus-veneris]